MPEAAAPDLAEICRHFTDLAEEDIAYIEDLAGKLSAVAELTGTDIFIDALTDNRTDAIVLAWARPGRRSLYRHSVVGEIAYATREPAVYQAFSTGETMRDVRGESQEGVPIAQTVVPLRNSCRRIIGVLIMERDISSEIRQEERVEFLSETAERLSSTLMSLSMTGYTWEEWLGNGIFVLNHKGVITYTNKNAARLYRQYCGGEPLSGELLPVLGYRLLSELLAELVSPTEFAFGETRYLLQAHPLVTYGEVSGCVISLQDVTELRRKERQLDAQSAIIREIHHRVKNNLQNVVALLRLQMRRTDSPPVQKEFEACVNRILSIACVYDVFAYQSWDSIDLQELAGFVLSKLTDNFALPEQTIHTSVRGQAVRVTASQAVPLAMVINELVTNSLKHGIKDSPYGEISIYVEESDGTVQMLVADSGKAFAPSCQGDYGNHLGLYIVNLLICEQMEGSFQLERRGGSTVAHVSFLLSKTEETA